MSVENPSVEILDPFPPASVTSKHETHARDPRLDL